jgi:hypothetical protein
VTLFSASDPTISLALSCGLTIDLPHGKDIDRVG